VLPQSQWFARYAQAAPSSNHDVIEAAAGGPWRSAYDVDLDSTSTRGRSRITIGEEERAVGPGKRVSVPGGGRRTLARRGRGAAADDDHVRAGADHRGVFEAFFAPSSSGACLPGHRAPRLR
jgi:hypothetical protein